MTTNAGYMPVCLKVKGEECLVVGGGKVAWRKIAVLKKFGARVTCLSPEFVPEIQQLGCNDEINLNQQRYPKKISLKKYKLVVAATNDAVVNQKVFDDAIRANVLVNVVDKSAPGTMIMSAIVKRKGFVIGVSTGGRNPGAAKKVRDILNHAL